MDKNYIDKCVDEYVNKLVINQLTREEYRELKEAGLVKHNEIYLFPDATEDDIEALRQKVEELIASHNELVEIVVEGNSEHPAIVDVLFGKDGKDGLIDRVRDLENVKIEVEDLKLRTEIIEKWIENRGSEGWDETRIKDIEESVEDLSDKVDEQEQKLQEVTNNYTTLDGRVTNIENNAIMADESSESSEEEFDGLIIFGGTSTKVIEDLVPTV